MEERVDRIERERREEHQRAFERRAHVLVTLIWMLNAAIVALTVARVAAS